MPHRAGPDRRIVAALGAQDAGRGHLTRDATAPDPRIGLPIAFSVALKQVIGGGVIVLTGTAVGLTGAGAWLAYAIACVVVLLVSLPYAALGAARPMSGALYRWPARFIHPTAGFLGFWVVLGTHVALSAYAATFGATLHALLPAIPASAAGLGALALVLALNLLGTEVSGVANIVVMGLVAASLAALAIVGLPQIDPRRLLPLLPHGWSGLLSAAALLTFPISGATLVSELAGEMRRPARDVPVAILGATAAAAALYVAVALVAACIPGLPQAPSLDLVAHRVMGAPGAAAFALGTGIVSMLGIMNTHLLWGSRSILMVCRDGWFPPVLARPNRRGAPVFPLCLLGAIGAVPLLAGLDVADVIRIGGLGASVSAILSIACAPLNARADPAAYAASPLPVPRPALLTVSIAAIAAQLATMGLLLATLPLRLALLWLGWVAVGLGFAVARRKARALPWTRQRRRLCKPTKE